MPTLSISKNYEDGTALLESDLDDIRNDVQDFVNTTKLDNSNIQAGGLATANYADSSVTTAKVANSAITAEKLAAAVTPPSGAIVAYGGTTAPTGWLLCDGTSYAVSSYGDLHTAIGDAFGGDGGTNFNVPDFRGRFLRGFDDSAGNDPDAGSRTAMNTGGNTGDNIGSIQADATDVNGLSATTSSDGSHVHSVLTDSSGGDDTPVIDTAVNAGETPSYATQNNDSINFLGSNGAHTHTITPASSDNETRPLNASVNYIIKT